MTVDQEASSGLHKSAMVTNTLTNQKETGWNPFGPRLAIERVNKEQGVMIRLGTTKLADYTKISVLGKGTYGEVHKCVHNPTSQVVAMKTFLFEVSHYK